MLCYCLLIWIGLHTHTVSIGDFFNNIDVIYAYQFAYQWTHLDWSDWQYSGGLHGRWCWLVQSVAGFPISLVCFLWHSYYFLPVPMVCILIESLMYATPRWLGALILIHRSGVPLWDPLRRVIVNTWLQVVWGGPPPASYRWDVIVE